MNNMEPTKRYSLEEAGNRVPFEVPENYFEDFAARMESLTAPQRVPLKRMMKPWMYMAAMFTGLLLAGNLFFQLYQSRSIQQESEAYEVYLMSQLDESVYYDYYLSSVGSHEESKSTEASE